MFKNNFIIFILIISLNYCFNEELISKEVFDHRIKQMKSHFNRLFDQMSNDLIKVKEQTWDECKEDWFTYSDRKCFKALDIKGSIDEAKRNCSEIDSSLITIQSEEEQLFISNILENYDNFGDFIWIGLEMSENNGYKWLDGNDVKYENWDDNADKKEKCVQISSGKSSLGKWTDAECSKKYSIICEKKQNSKTVFSEKLKNLTKFIEIQENELKNQKKYFTQELKKQDNIISKQTKVIERQENYIKDLKLENQNQDYQINSQGKRIKTLEDTTIPIGFIYTQLPQQLKPQQLWPYTKWEEITPTYAGLFFRAEGGESGSFGTNQQANYPGFSYVWASHQRYSGPGEHTNSTTYSLVNQRYNVYHKGWPIFGIEFVLSSKENRPVNTAVRIWKRIE